MRRLAVAAFVAVAVALIGAGATFAGSDHGHGHRGLSFFSTENSFAPVPVTAGKFSVGDRVVFSDDLFIAKGGAQVGTDGGECTTVRVTDAAAASGVLQCLVTFSLPGGQITTQALNTLQAAGSPARRRAPSQAGRAATAEPRASSRSNSSAAAPRTSRSTSTTEQTSHGARAHGTARAPCAAPSGATQIATTDRCDPGRPGPYRRPNSRRARRPTLTVTRTSLSAPSIRVSEGR